MPCLQASVSDIQDDCSFGSRIVSGRRSSPLYCLNINNGSLNMRSRVSKAVAVVVLSPLVILFGNEVATLDRAAYWLNVLIGFLVSFATGILAGRFAGRLAWISLLVGLGSTLGLVALVSAFRIRTVRLSAILVLGYVLLAVMTAFWVGKRAEKS